MKASEMQREIEACFDPDHYDIPADVARWIFEDGFIAGAHAAEEQRQAQSAASSQAVGTTSQYPGEAEEPEEEA